MLTYESLVWVIFRAIDSLILIALAAWLFIRKALPYLHQQIATEHRERKSLNRAVEDLEYDAKTLDDRLLADTHDIERLEQKVRLWQQAVKRKHIRDTTEKEDILVRLHKQDEQREHTVRHQKFYATALLEATENAERILKKDIDNAETVEKIVQFMATHKESA